MQIRFLSLPLLLVTGASGAGKSAVAGLLPQFLPECVVLDSDLLWRKGLVDEFHDIWLRVAAAINQNGRPTLLCGTVVPEKIESLTYRRYFSRVSYVALVSDEATLRARLDARPAWRFHGTSRDETITRMLNFNRWLRENAARTIPPMDVLDTSTLTQEQVAGRVASWARAQLSDGASAGTGK